MKKTIIIGMIVLMAMIGIASAETIYQENANSTTLYAIGGAWQWGDGSYLYDGDWETGDSVDQGKGGIYVNYTNRPNTVNIIWQVKDDIETINLTIPTDGNSSNIRLWAEYDNYDAFVNWFYFNYTANNWTVLRSNTNAYRIWEEAVYFEISTAECYNDYDCGFCEYCDEGTCENQYQTDTKTDCGFCEACDGYGGCSGIAAVGLDPHNECGTDVLCQSDYAYFIPTGNCDGAQNCDLGIFPWAVSDGRVCINSTSYDVSPTADVNAGIWSACVATETSADEYYVGYCNPDYPLSYGSQYACDAGWVSAGTTQEATEGYWWDITQHIDTCTEELMPECFDDYDCGTCHICNAGTCEPAPYDTDPKDECAPTWDCGGYSNNSIYRSQPGNCISGYCRASYWFPGDETYVSDGNICALALGQDENPTADYNAGIWSDCIEGETTAPEYYVGYCSGTPCDTEWITAGTIWNATSGYEINQSEHVDTCSEALASRVGGGGSSWPEETPTPTITTKAPTFSLLGLESINLQEIWTNIINWIKTWWR